MFRVILGYLPLISSLWVDAQGNPNNITNVQQATVSNTVDVEPIVAAASGYGYQSKPYNNYGSSYSGGSYSDREYNTKDCYGKPVGYRGDPAYDCKVFEVCQSDGRFDTFYCPDYTRFNNYLSICDWADKVDSYCNPTYPYAYEDYGNQPNYEYDKPKYASPYVPVYEPTQYFRPKFEYPKYEPVYAKNPVRSSYGEYTAPPSERRYGEYRKEPYSPPDYGQQPASYPTNDRKVGYDKVYEPSHDSPYVPNFLTKKYR